MPIDRTLSNMNFKNCSGCNGKLFWKVVKTVPENFFACVFILTASDPNFQIYYANIYICMLFSVLFKFLTNIKCLFSWENSIKSVKVLVIPHLLQLQIFINKTDTKNLASDLPCNVLNSILTTHDGV